MNYYALTSLFNGIVVLLIGFYLLFQQKQNDLYQSCAVLSMGVGLWCVFYSFWQAQTSYNGALTYMRLAMTFCYAIPFSFLWLTLKLIHAPLRPWQGVMLLAVPLLFMIFGFSPLMIKEMKSVAGFHFWPRPGILMHFFVVIFFCVVLFSYSLLLKRYLSASGFLRRQIQWVMLALLPAWLGGATNWCLWYDIPVPPVAHIFVGVGFLLLFYAIARSRLFDIDTITDLVQEAKLSALGIMATSINHEVRNPLFVIKGLAEILLDRPDTDREKVKDIAQRTVAQAERALEIIRNFSSYAKRQSSKTFEKQSLDVKEVLESVVPLVCSELALDKIRLQVNVPPKTMICADRHSLEEIFINLIVNACQAMSEGGEIEISAKDEKPWLSIKIRDTGPGLPPEQLTRIFEPFYTTKASGTGLGLYVVKQLVEKNSGRVEASSKEGLGTTFTLLFPK
jgi:signal transduction histidine kinase